MLRRGDGAILGGLRVNQEDDVNQEAKKTTLRMIPYGLYVLTTGSEGGPVAAATVK